MHYYKFNIADYRKDTVHLSIVEHYIYRQLIDWHYLDELPIPLETQSVMRRLCLGTQDEASLLNVLSDFFVKRDDGWIHERILFEINEYHEMLNKNKSNGKKGGRPKKQQVTEEINPVGYQSDASGNPGVTLTNKPETNNHKPITSSKEKAKRFVPPTHTEVMRYCLERKNNVDPDRFIDHYTSNGWLVGKNKMKDWKAAVRTWEKNEKQSAPQTKVLDFPQ